MQKANILTSTYTKLFSILATFKIQIALIFAGLTYAAIILMLNDHLEGDYQIFVSEPVSLSFAIERWYEWSSRFFIEASVNIFSKYLHLWVFVTVVMGAVLVWSLGRILKVKRLYQVVLLLCLLLMISSSLLATAGVFATTINYLWPAACFLFVLSIVMHPLTNNKAKPAIIALAGIATLFALSNEQLALCGVLISATYIAYKIYKRERVSLIVYLLFVLSLGAIVNVLLAPGNDVRAVSEINFWWPGFDELSLQYKLAVGTITVFSRLFIAPELLALLFILVVAVYSIYSKNIKSFTALMPALTILVLIRFPDTYGQQETAIRTSNYFNDLAQSLINLNPQTIPGSVEIIGILLIITIFGISLFLSTLFLLTKIHQRLIFNGLLLMAVAVSLVVSLSPTLFASSTRTLYPTLIILVILNYQLINEIIVNKFHQGNVPHKIVKG